MLARQDPPDAGDGLSRQQDRIPALRAGGGPAGEEVGAFRAVRPIGQEEDAWTLVGAGALEEQLRGLRIVGGQGIHDGDGAALAAGQAAQREGPGIRRVPAHAQECRSRGMPRRSATARAAPALSGWLAQAASSGVAQDRRLARADEVID